MNKFAKTLERLVKEKGITYYQLSKETGIPKQTIHDYTGDPKKVSIENVVKLARYFDISIDRLICDRQPIELIKKQTVLDFKLKQIQTIISTD